MKKNSSTMHINLIPVLIIVLLIIGAGYFMTEGDLKIPFFSKSNEMEAVHVEGFPREVATTAQLDKKRVVIKSQQELEAFLKEIDPTGFTKVEEEINFDREWVIAVSTETKETDGYRLKARKAFWADDGEKLMINLLLTEPGDNCETQEVSSVFVDMIKIDHIEQEIDFERFKETRFCESDEESSNDESSEATESEEDVVDLSQDEEEQNQ